MKAKSILYKCLLCLLFLLTALCSSAIGKIIYVDDDAAGANDGSSWQNAYTFLQDALTDANSAEEPVYFADANLKQAVENALGVTDPTPMDMLGFTTLNAISMKIINLTGIEYATNLQTLTLWDNRISDLSPLSDLMSLECLLLEKNRISDLSPLCNSTSLKKLDLYRNQIIDISPLSGLMSLLELELGRNQISDISPLSSLTNLQTLNLWYNQISNISGLSGLTTLQCLSLENNQISNIPPLYDLNSLLELHLENNQISDISDLSGLTNLSELHLENNQISDLSGLSGLTNLKLLYSSDNQISDISPLSRLTNLERLFLDNNQISDFSPLSELTNLQTLYLRNNRIIDISLSDGLTNLRTLRLGGNQISDLSLLTNLTNINGLDLHGNQISDVSPLSELTSLQWLLLKNNRISDISMLSGLINLTQLDLISNQISDISPLSGLTRLKWLYLSDNQISDISPLSEFTNLVVLKLRSNPLGPDAYTIYIPLIESYGTNIYYDPPAWHTLTIDSTVGGMVVEPGEGDFDYINLTVVNIETSADSGYYFVEWTGTAVDAGKVTDPYSADTTVTIDADYTLSANFEQNEFTFIYVDDDATGVNDGTSWENAYVFLQDALANAETGEKPIMIHVAQGTYTPDKGVGQIPGDREATFQLINGVTLKGGFAGLGEPDPNACDAGQYKSVLSGDLNADDDPNITNIWDNSFHVVTTSGTQWTAMLEGLTITGGNADGPCPYNNGGGIYNVEGRPTLTNCTLSRNSTTGNGGGMYNCSASQPNLTNCLFICNSAINGGGMENLDTSQPILTNCTFSANIAENTGGGISNLNDNQSTLINCILWGDIPDEIRGESAYVLYSDIEGGWSGVGMGNLDIDPLFADPDKGDYHLKSQSGRFDPNSGSWVIDNVTSPCIDAGDPSIPVGFERSPNGDRVNIGAYGGTSEASLSSQQPLGQASNPNPLDGDARVARNITLTWTPGFEGALHNVYLGIEFDNANPSNVYSVPVSQHQTDTSYNPGLLEYGQTYYWRIDEVDHRGILVPGKVWSFTMIPAPPKGVACFTGQTKVWIDRAAIAISEVSIGQSTGNNIGKVKAVQEHEGTFILYDIALESGNSITVAENHYFMTESGMWLSLHDLKEGKRLKTSKGSVGIKSIGKRQKPCTGKVYNLKIENSDQYLVGEDAIIVRDY